MYLCLLHWCNLLLIGRYYVTLYHIQSLYYFVQCFVKMVRYTAIALEIIWVVPRMLVAFVGSEFPFGNMFAQVSRSSGLNITIYQS